MEGWPQPGQDRTGAAAGGGRGCTDGVLMTVLVLAFAMLLLFWLGVLLAFAGPLAARWREPVLRSPVLIIESDDWGAGPLQQADALRCIAALLQRVRDRSGRQAVMTLGVVLE